jgi:hypothetical protein
MKTRDHQDHQGLAASAAELEDRKRSRLNLGSELSTLMKIER